VCWCCCLTGLSRLTSLRWLCLRWLDRLPVAYLAPLTNLVALQLKNIDKPPGTFVSLTQIFLGAAVPGDSPWLAAQVQ